jgi:hypothetical protein
VLEEGGALKSVKVAVLACYYWLNGLKDFALLIS